MLAALRQGLKGKTGRQAAVILGFLGLANIIIWAAALTVFRHYPLLLGTSLLAYSFGLRHAVDADHIAAIDNVTRKLMRQGQRPVGVGLFFSLGHSTIVFALSGVVAIVTVAVRTVAIGGSFTLLESWGGIFGTFVSGIFLLGIALANLVILRALIATFRRVRKSGVYCDDDVDILLAGRGFLARIFRGLFRMIGKSWHMYPLGLLFGLGFDTATEIGLLGISAAAASKGLPIWSIMIFPALFTAGMALADTADSVLMLGAYGWAFMKPMRKLFYNITITAVSVLVAVAIGGLEILGLIQSACNLSGRFWDKVSLLNGDSVFGLLGYAIIGIFAAAWIISISVYKLRRYDEIDVALTE